MCVSRPAASEDALLTIAEVLASDPGSEQAGRYVWDGG